MNEPRPVPQIPFLLVIMTAPLVPAEVDLRAYDFVPIFRRRLLASRFHRLATSEEWRAGFLLWLKSWDEVPAGSLPNDDRELWKLAEVANNVEWRKIKKMALHGWVKCDDGRLYHPVVAEVALDAWERKQAFRKRTEAATAARIAKRDGQRNVDDTGGSSATGPKTRKQNASPKSPSRNGEGDFFSNGQDKDARPAVEPKRIGHALPCDCPNCTAWVAQQRGTE